MPETFEVVEQKSVQSFFENDKISIKQKKAVLDRFKNYHPTRANKPGLTPIAPENLFGRFNLSTKESLDEKIRDLIKSVDSYLGSLEVSSNSSGESGKETIV